MPPAGAFFFRLLFPPIPILHCSGPTESVLHWVSVGPVAGLCRTGKRAFPVSCVTSSVRTRLYIVGDRIREGELHGSRKSGAQQTAAERDPRAAVRGAGEGRDRGDRHRRLHAVVARRRPASQG